MMTKNFEITVEADRYGATVYIGHHRIYYRDCNTAYWNNWVAQIYDPALGENRETTSEEKIEIILGDFSRKLEKLLLADEDT